MSTPNLIQFIALILCFTPICRVSQLDHRMVKFGGRDDQIMCPQLPPVRRMPAALISFDFSISLDRVLRKAGVDRTAIYRRSRAMQILWFSGSECWVSPPLPPHSRPSMALNPMMHREASQLVRILWYLPVMLKLLPVGGSRES